MDPYFGATRPYYKSYKILEVVSSLMMRIAILKTLKYRKIHKKFILKKLVDNVKSKLINMLKDIVY
jgi:predicted AAA+ superfamily ATPase